MDQNAAYSGSEWSLQRRPFQCVLGQASRAFSSMSIAAPNCCQRAVLHKVSIYIAPCVIALNQAARARTQWYAPRQGEQPGHHTQGDSPRRTNVWSLDTYGQ